MAPRFLSSSLSVSTTYEEIISVYNKLESNTPKNRLSRLQDCKKYLVRTGLKLDDINRIPIIHVAGTKGKGSTCAFTESILRHHGLKTAMFTRPHVVKVRDNLKINAKPIDEKIFINKFVQVYNMLDNLKDNEFDMPSRFTFLTLVIFHIILESDIDVAIIEAGCGGEFDSTNIIQQPICVGITLLHFDHMEVLGNDLSSIAWHKAGIFKTNVPAYTLEQFPEAYDVLHKRSIEKNCNLTIVTDDKLKILKTNPPKLGIEGNVQNKNASLAMQLAETFIEKFNKNKNQQNIINFDKNIVEEALKNTKWAGRYQVIYGKYLNCYLDGARISYSIETCIDWFNKHVIEHTKNNNYNNDNPLKKILILNTTLDLNSAIINFKLLKNLNFDIVYFVTHLSDLVDIQSNTHSIEKQMKKCQEVAEAWTYSPAIIKQNINQALDDILKNNKSNTNKTMVLITGSLYLMGPALAILDKDFAPNKNNIIDF